MLMCKQVKVADIEKANGLIRKAKEYHKELKWVRALGGNVRIEGFRSSDTQYCDRNEETAIQMRKVFINIKEEYIRIILAQLKEMGIDTTDLEAELV